MSSLVNVCSCPFPIICGWWEFIVYPGHPQGWKWFARTCLVVHAFILSTGSFTEQILNFEEVQFIDLFPFKGVAPGLHLHTDTKGSGTTKWKDASTHLRLFLSRSCRQHVGIFPGSSPRGHGPVLALRSRHHHLRHPETWCSSFSHSCLTFQSCFSYFISFLFPETF